MRNAGIVIVGAAAAVLLAGCSGQGDKSKRDSQMTWNMTGLPGNWVLRDVYPPEGARNFALVGVTFNRDYTYVGRTVRDGQRIETSRGTYTYDEWARKLTLHTGNEKRDYGAWILFGTELRVEGQTPDGGKVTAVMVRSNLPVEPLSSAPPANSDRRAR